MNIDPTASAVPRPRPEMRGAKTIALTVSRIVGALATDVFMVVAGASLLWTFPTGSNVGSVSPLGALLLVIAAGGCLFVRTLLHRSAAPARDGRWLPRRLLIAGGTGRGVLLVAIAATSVGWTSYFWQWVTSYATMVFATLGAVSVVRSFAQGRRNWDYATGVVTMVCGIAGIVVTHDVHDYDPTILGPVVVLTVSSLFLSRICMFWYEVTVRGASRTERSPS